MASLHFASTLCGLRTRLGHPLRRQARQSTRVCAVVASAGADRQLWLPGITPPTYLDGTLAGDVGFDPLGLAADESDRRWFVQAELVHSRWAMMGVAGMLATDVLASSGVASLPRWFEAGAHTYAIASVPTLLALQLLLFAFVETKRLADFRAPGSQGQDEAFFFFLEPALLGTENGYPGGPLFNPLGFATSKVTAGPLKEKELANGRLAMVAAVGFFAQYAATGEGPVANLLLHLSDPWHTTLVHTLHL